MADAACIIIDVGSTEGRSRVLHPAESVPPNRVLHEAFIGAESCVLTVGGSHLRLDKEFQLKLAQE